MSIGVEAAFMPVRVRNEGASRVKEAAQTPIGARLDYIAGRYVEAARR